MTEIRRIDIAEFRELGWIHEINRLLLHPAGLALEVTVEPCTECDEGCGVEPKDCQACKGTRTIERLGGVWDDRDDPEGIYYGDDLLSSEKAARIAGILEERRAAREAAVGYFIQPVGGTTIEQAIANGSALLEQSAVPEREITAARTSSDACSGDGTHIVSVQLRGGPVESAEQVIAAIKAHEAHYVITPMPGMAGYDQHARDGRRLLVRVLACPHCAREVLWA